MSPSELPSSVTTARRTPPPLNGAARTGLSHSEPDEPLRRLPGAFPGALRAGLDGDFGALPFVATTGDLYYMGSCALIFVYQDSSTWRRMSSEWKGNSRHGGTRRGAGRKPVGIDQLLKGPIPIRFSTTDLDWIGQAMQIEDVDNFSKWARTTLVRHARRTILQEQKDRTSDL